MIIDRTCEKHSKDDAPQGNLTWWYATTEQCQAKRSTKIPDEAQISNLVAEISISSYFRLRQPPKLLGPRFSWQCNVSTDQKRAGSVDIRYGAITKCISWTCVEPQDSFLHRQNETCFSISNVHMFMENKCELFCADGWLLYNQRS